MTVPAVALCRVCDVLLAPPAVACPACGAVDPAARPALEAVLVTPVRTALGLLAALPALALADRLVVLLV